MNKELKPALTHRQARTLEYLEPFYDGGRSAVLACLTRSSAQLQASQESIAQVRAYRQRLETMLDLAKAAEARLQPCTR